MRRARSPFLLMCVALGIVAGACGSSPQTRLYILDSTAAAGKLASPDLSVGVGPVNFSSYLDRSEMVTLASANQLSLADFDQWAEPLEDGFVRVLREDLASVLGTDRVVAAGNSGTDVEVAVDVIRFDADARGGATLVARWSVRGSDDEILVPRRKSEISMKASGAGFGPVAAAMSRAVGKLASEIAGEIETVRGNR